MKKRQRKRGLPRKKNMKESGDTERRERIANGKEDRKLAQMTALKSLFLFFCSVFGLRQRKHQLTVMVNIKSKH